jgi:hypothetical protein
MCIFIIYDDNVVVHEDVVATVYIKEDNSCVYLFYSAGCTLRKNHQTEEINDDLVCCLSRSRLYQLVSQLYSLDGLRISGRNQGYCSFFPLRSVKKQCPPKEKETRGCVCVCRGVWACVRNVTSCK